VISTHFPEASTIPETIATQMRAAVNAMSAILVAPLELARRLGRGAVGKDQVGQAGDVFVVQSIGV
jgi:hypothetical protein